MILVDDNKVAVLLEDLRSQFWTFGEGLQLLNEKVDNGFEMLTNRVDNLEKNNHQEHQQLKQIVKELDREVQVEIKRVK